MLLPRERALVLSPLPATTVKALNTILSFCRLPKARSPNTVELARGILHTSILQASDSISKLFLPWHLPLSNHPPILYPRNLHQCSNSSWGMIFIGILPWRKYECRNIYINGSQPF